MSLQNWISTFPELTVEEEQGLQAAKLRVRVLAPSLSKSKNTNVFFLNENVFFYGEIKSNKIHIKHAPNIFLIQYNGWAFCSKLNSFEHHDSNI